MYFFFIILFLKDKLEIIVTMNNKHSHLRRDYKLSVPVSLLVESLNDTITP